MLTVQLLTYIQALLTVCIQVTLLLISFILSRTHMYTCIHWLTGEYSLFTDYRDLHAVAKTICNKTKRKKEKEKKVFSIHFNMMKVEL